MTKPKKYWEDILATHGDESRDSIICKVCGRPFLYLGAHIKVHGMSANEYKDRFGMLYKTPLCVSELSVGFSETNNRMISNGIIGTPEHIRKLVSSNRNLGKHGSIAQKIEIGKARSGKAMSDSSKKKMSVAAKNRTPLHRERLRMAALKQFADHREIIVCSNCKKQFMRISSRIDKKASNLFCGYDCFFEFVRKNGKLWAEHCKATIDFSG